MEGALPKTRTAAAPAVVQDAPRRSVGDYVAHAALIFGALLMLFPFYWMITTALKTQADANTFPPQLLPQSFHPENFITAWNLAPFGRYFFNSFVTSTAQVALVLFTSTLSAYAFARFEFVGKNIIFMLFLATLMIPYEVTLVPNFILIQSLGWYNTYLALIVPWSASVFAVFLLRQYFLTLPKDLWDAARIDGCSELRYFWTIVLPLSRPALVTVALFTFLGGWNSLLWPLIMTSSEDMRVVQVGLSAFTGESGSRNELLMAAASLTMAPIALLYFAAQRYFVDGISASGIKG